MREYIPKDWRCNEYRWRELVNYCKQYSRWKQERSDIILEYRASMSGSIAVKQSGGASPVEQKAERLEALDKHIDLVESCCREATKSRPYLYTSLFKSVTESIPLQYIDCPVSVKQLSHYRKYFYYILDQRKD